MKPATSPSPSPVPAPAPAPTASNSNGIPAATATTTSPLLAMKYAASNNASSANANQNSNNNNAKPPRPPRPPDFLLLQTRLKREHVMITTELDAIKRQHEDIQNGTENLLLSSHYVQILSRKVDMLLNSKLSIENWKEFDAEKKDRFSNLYIKFSTQTTYYENFIKILWKNPKYLAKTLGTMKDLKETEQDEIIHAILASLYGNFLTPHEERNVLQIILFIMELSFQSSKDNQHTWLRENSLFTKFFTAYAKNYANGKLYLKAALKEPLTNVLVDDNLNLEVEPLKVYSSLSADQRADFGLPLTNDGTIDSATLVNNPAMKKILDETYQEIKKKCASFIANLTEKLPLMPYGIRLICRDLLRIATSRGISISEAESLVGDIIFQRFINPAILYPEPYGIINDTPISLAARRNLTLIAKVLRNLFRSRAVSQRESYMIPLQEALGNMSLSLFFQQLQNIPDLKDGLPFVEDVDVHVGRKQEVCLTVRDIVLFQNLFSRAEEVPAELEPVLKKMTQTVEPDGSLVLVSIGDPQDGFYILSEEEVLTQNETPIPTAQAVRDLTSQDQAEIANKQPLIKEVKKQLRNILSRLNLNRGWKALGLMDVLKAESMEANALENETVAQISEAMRQVRYLPEAYKRNNYYLLLEEMLLENRARSSYITYLVRIRQDLLLTLDQLRYHQSHVEHSRQICHQFYKTMQIRNFLDKREAEVVKFVTIFNATDMLDEKAQHIKRYLEETMTLLSQNPLWTSATPEALQEANLLLEKYFMCRIYANAFHPSGENDARKDMIFQEQIRQISNKYSLDDEALRIDPKYRSQAPWPLAQKELHKINLYKTAGDKLGCVVQCCKTIMRLISINGKDVGADDMFPVLVYVILVANPPNILSTKQYIEYFYEKRMQGEERYWWSQFVQAINFIITLLNKK